MCFWPVQCHRQTFSALCQGGYRSSPPPPSTKWRLARSSDASLPPNASTPPSSAESFAGNTKQKKTSVEPICQPQLLLLFFCVFTQWRSSSKDDGRCFSLSAESRALPSIYNTHEREREREPHPCLIFCRGDDTLKILLFVSSLIGIFDSPSHTCYYRVIIIILEERRIFSSRQTWSWYSKNGFGTNHSVIRAQAPLSAEDNLLRARYRTPVHSTTSRFLLLRRSSLWVLCDPFLRVTNY